MEIMDLKKNEELVVGLIKKLNDCGYFMAKSGVCYLIPFIYASVGVKNQ
jgi:hypothetical protein